MVWFLSFASFHLPSQSSNQAIISRHHLCYETPRPL
jgi:hypothetical protein